MTMEESGNFTVIEENKEGTLMTVSSPVRKSKYTIYKPEDGYSMFKIKSESGSIPESLSGYYTSRKAALNSLVYWLEHTPESKQAKWDRMFGEEKAPPLKTKKDKEPKVGSTN